jgi:hypothetical protein
LNHKEYEVAHERDEDLVSYIVEEALPEEEYNDSDNICFKYAIISLMSQMTNELHSIPSSKDPVEL